MGRELPKLLLFPSPQLVEQTLASPFMDVVAPTGKDLHKRELLKLAIEVFGLIRKIWAQGRQNLGIKPVGYSHGPHRRL